MTLTRRGLMAAFAGIAASSSAPRVSPKEIASLGAASSGCAVPCNEPLDRSEQWFRDANMVRSQLFREEQRIARSSEGGVAPRYMAMKSWSHQQKLRATDRDLAAIAEALRAMERADTIDIVLTKLGLGK